MVVYLRPSLDEWLAQEAVQPGKLRDVVMEVQTRVNEARDAAGSQ